MILIHIQYIINTPICDIYNMILTHTIYVEYTYMTYEIYIYTYNLILIHIQYIINMPIYDILHDTIYIYVYI